MPLPLDVVLLIGDALGVLAVPLSYASRAFWHVLRRRVIRVTLHGHSQGPPQPAYLCTMRWAPPPSLHSRST